MGHRLGLFLHFYAVTRKQMAQNRITAQKCYNTLQAIIPYLKKQFKARLWDILLIFFRKWQDWRAFVWSARGLML
jgi:hypothetical protein